MCLRTRIYPPNRSQLQPNYFNYERRVILVLLSAFCAQVHSSKIQLVTLCSNSYKLLRSSRLERQRVAKIATHKRKEKEEKPHA